MIAAMLSADVYVALERALAPADEALTRDYPGSDGQRQPVHTVYVPADRYDADLPGRWGTQASVALAERIATPAQLARLLDVDATIAAQVLPRVVAKLATEPIEDLRIDFEDGYGQRSDSEEDAAATAAGQAVATTGAARPPFAGLRFKSLEPATRQRGVHTVDLFLSGLLAAGSWPDGFRLTLPKVTHVDQVSAFADVCTALESAHSLPSGTLRFEVQIETPQAVLAADGTAAVARMVHAGHGRVNGLHYGTYDFSAAAGIAAPYQSLEHPIADHAKSVLLLAAAGTGVAISDGSTNILPVGAPTQIESAWRLHARLVRRSLERGFYQGWDLHPLQLVTRFAATYAFYREGMPSACDRLRVYLDRAGSSPTAILDEPATAQAMAALLVRGLQCGALDEGEVAARSGVAMGELEALYRRRVGGADPVGSSA
jgi:HpcH/HpaI aldolase/citrate lyase family